MAGANHTIVSFNVNAIKIHNATSSLVHLEKNSAKEKRSSLQQRWRCSCKFRNRRIGHMSKSFDSWIYNAGVVTHDL
jgi:hypothetical protein